MNLKNKKRLIARVLGVGIGRVVLPGEMEQIKEAITRQDIKDLEKQGVIKIREMKGRKKKIKTGKRKGEGSIKRKIKKRKNYVIITRKLRKYVKSLKNRIGKEEYYNLTKKMKTGIFLDLSHLKEYARGEKIK